MDNQYREVLRSQLMEEITRIDDHVKAFGAPRRTEERSLIARYGKLLLVSQQLLSLLTRAEQRGGGDAAVRRRSMERSMINRSGAGSFSRHLGLN